MERVTVACGEVGADDVTFSSQATSSYEHLDTVLSILSYLLKAPNVPAGTPVINALNRQKQAIENVLRALIGLPAENGMLMECRVPTLRERHLHNTASQSSLANMKVYNEKRAL